MRSRTGPNLEPIASLGADELAGAAALLGRAYRDNPLTFALLGNDPHVRESVTAEIFELRIRAMDPPPLGARGPAGLVGACGFDAPGGSRITPESQRRLAEVFASAGEGVFPRAMSMLSEFGRHTPSESHWHLGPVGVELDRQGEGIGSAMLQAFCARMDEQNAASFLETDQEQNASLYEKFGFVTVETASVIGVPMWFMARRPR